MCVQSDFIFCIPQPNHCNIYYLMCLGVPPLQGPRCQLINLHKTPYEWERLLFTHLPSFLKVAALVSWRSLMKASAWNCVGLVAPRRVPPGFNSILEPRGMIRTSAMHTAWANWTISTLTPCNCETTFQIVNHPLDKCHRKRWVNWLTNEEW